MAISFVGSKTFSHNATSAQSCSLTDLKDTAGVDAVLAPGDMIVINFSHAGSLITAAQGTPTGYTAATPAITAAANRSTIVVSSAVMGAAPDTTVSIPAALTTNNFVAVTIHAFRGALGFFVTPTSASGTASTTADAPSVTPDTTGDWVLAAAGQGNVSAAPTALTNPAGMSGTTNHFRAVTGQVGVFGGGAAMALYTAWAAGAYDPAVFGGGSAAVNGEWTAASLVLRAALPSGAPLPYRSPYIPFLAR